MGERQLLECRVFTRSIPLRSLCRARAILADTQAMPAPTIDAIAREVGISPFHFIRRFEAAFGATPHRFRTAERLDRAKRLLALGNHSVTDVCFEVGFSSLGSFSDLFRRHVGASPSAYRRRVRKLVVVPGRLPWQLEPGCLTLMAHLPAGAFRSFREADAVGVL